MANTPSNPKIYHITHVRNLPQIVRSGVLWSDAKRIEMKLNCEVVGMSHIKQRRLREIEVACHPGTHVGDYVPFYFCPRSIMLYILHKGNHPDLNYSEGQQPIVHLQADLLAVASWAKRNARAWAFTNCNAGALYVSCFNDLAQLDEVNWQAVEAMDFRSPGVREGKQAEFLIQESFPWELVERIGVQNAPIARQVKEVISGAGHRPDAAVESKWYY